MRGNHRHIFLNFIIMLAIIGAGISPACKFISGQQTWLEICGADGIKKVLLAADDVPGAPDHQDHAQTDPCAFCLTHSSVKVIAADNISVTIPVTQISSAETSASAEHYELAEYRNTYPRGPPVLL